MKQYYVYIMANRSRPLYTGVTNDLQKRVYGEEQIKGLLRSKKVELIELINANWDDLTDTSR